MRQSEGWGRRKLLCLLWESNMLSRRCLDQLQTYLEYYMPHVYFPSGDYTQKRDSQLSSFDVTIDKCFPTRGHASISRLSPLRRES